MYGICGRYIPMTNLKWIEWKYDKKVDNLKSSVKI